jgi:hypothetical protein
VAGRRDVGRGRATFTPVILGFMPRIDCTTTFVASGSMDPRDKPEDDKRDGWESLAIQFNLHSYVPPRAKLLLHCRSQ